MSPRSWYGLCCELAKTAKLVANRNQRGLKGGSMSRFSNILVGFVIALLSVLGVESTQAANNQITLAFAEEPPNLDSTKSTDTVSFMVVGHVMEGLTRLGKRGETLPGVATKWEISEKGATFWLRKDAKWSDGKPVTAKDFVFAWRTVVDPATASQYAFIMYSIKNAEAINQGKAKPETLGVTAVDDWTLKVEFEKPCGYFVGLTSFGTFMPIREDFHKSTKGAYGAEAANLLYNGPFKLTKWVHGASLRLEKSETYWNKGEIQIDVIDIPYITSDTNARFNLFKDGKIDFVSLDDQTMQNAIKEKLRIRKFAAGTIFYLEFNHRPGRATANRNLRKAIQLAFDANELVDKVLATPGNLPGVSLFPEWLPGVKGKFRQEYPAKPVKMNDVAAKEYLEKAKKELGGTIPDLVLLSGDSPTASKQVEYFQSLFKKKLGLNLKIDKQTFKQRLAKMTSGDFDIVSAGWGPDFNDPMTFADLFASWNENNRGRYKSDELDKWVRVAQASADPKVRMDAMAKVQDLVNEDVVVLPTYESSEIYVQSNRLDGVVRAVIGADPLYVYAKVKK